MANRLDQIIAATRERVARSKAALSLQGLADLSARAEKHVPRGFRSRLQQHSKSGAAVIAELKRASPSRGVIRPNLEVAATARALEENGAAALSVLTDEKYFQGSLADLREASFATTLPCLRKDFIIDAFQLVEAKAYGADAVLLIVAAFSPEQDGELARLGEGARNAGLDVLCEIHDEEDLARAIDAGVTHSMIGVNNRNLKNFTVDLGCGERLGPLLPSRALRVAESGIHSADDIRLLRRAGYEAFLIGELLMSADDPGARLAGLLADLRPSLRGT